jgi:hypothetical protein
MNCVSWVLLGFAQNPSYASANTDLAFQSLLLQPVGQAKVLQWCLRWQQQRWDAGSAFVATKRDVTMLVC